MARGASDYRYQHVQVRTWSDKRFRALSAPPPNARTLWLFLLSGEYTTKIPGVIANAGRAGMAEFLEWPVEAFDKCFSEIAQRHDTAGGDPMAIADWPNRLVYLPSAFKQPDNHPSSASEVVAWRKVLNNLPECELRDRIEHDLRLMLMTHSPSFLTSFVNARRTDLFSKHDNEKALAAVPLALPAASSLAPPPLPDPLPLPLPLPLPETHADSADASSASTGTQEGLKLEPPTSAPVLDFAAAYKLYPRKEGKKAGLRIAEAKIRTSGEYQLFVEAIRNYAALVVDEPYKRIKHFSTFMGCWEDYAPGNWQPPATTATNASDLGRGQVPVAKGLDYSSKGDS